MITQFGRAVVKNWMRLEFKLLPKTAIGRTYHWRGQILLSLDCRSPVRIPPHSIVTPLTHSTCVWLRYSTSSVSHKVTEYLKGYIWILTGPGGCAADPEEATEPGSGLKITDLPPEILENIFAFLHPGNLTFSREAVQCHCIQKSRIELDRSMIGDGRIEGLWTCFYLRHLHSLNSFCISDMGEYRD